jgi:molecular chaperone HtpG
MTQYEFQAEINQLLSLIINAFYSNKDIFLRELISNASDAIDKARFVQLTTNQEASSDFEITIKTDVENSCMRIEDNGIGMTKEDMITCLGTIANSGTKQFMQNLSEGNADVSMIGQFGVGFYSAYLVSKNVKVYSKHIDNGVCHKWESTAGGTFVVEEMKPDESPLSHSHGTLVELYVKDDCMHYLDESKLSDVVKTHSEFISHPIKLWTVRTETTQEDVSDEDVIDEVEDVVDVVDVEDVENNKETTKKKQTRDVEHVVEEWKHLNTQKPLWLKKPEDVSDAEYGAFYKSITNDWDSHMQVKHFAAEGQIEFKSILYIPNKMPSDMFSNKADKKSNLRLYVKRVLITDKCDDLVPEWLSFISGVVDSEDLPLNVSREVLQQNKIMKLISKNVVKKCMDMFMDINEDVSDEGKIKFTKFYDAFNKSIKFGIHEDERHREKLIQLLRFYTHNSQTEMVSLQSYVKSMPDKQQDIYYITGEDVTVLANSPFVRGIKERGYDVLLMTDAIDEYMLQTMRTFDSKNLVNVSKEGISFEEDNDESVKTMQNELNEKYTKFCEKLKTMLNGKVDKVDLSFRLNSEDPCCVCSSQYGWSANMERIMKAQTLQTGGDTSSQASFMTRKNFSINPYHTIISNMYESYVNTSISDDVMKNSVELLFDASMLASGYTPSDDLSKKIYNILSVVVANVESDEGVIGENVESDIGAKEGEKMEELD